MRKEVNTKPEESKGRKPKPQRNRKPKDFNAQALQEQEEKKDYNNHPALYYGDKELMEQASSFSMNQFLEADGTPFKGQFKDIKVPAIMNMYFNPSPGFTLGKNTSDGGINIAAMKLYTKLSSMNAKTTQYAPQDVATLMLALGEIVSMYTWTKRVFQVVFLYNKRNWAVPQALIRSMGVNYSDFIQHVADYRLQFNAIVNSINQISFPGDIRWFEKCATMYSHLYVDSESPMAQMYVFNPATTWIVDETSSDVGTILKTKDWCLDQTVTNGARRFRTMQEVLNELSDMIQAILNSATFNYIYADVLRLVDPQNLLTMPYIIEGDGIGTEFDPMMLLQINNAIVVSQPQGAGSESRTPMNDVYPVPEVNALRYAPQVSIAGSLGTKTIVNFPHSMGKPDVDQRCEAVRMITLLDGDAEFNVTDAAMPDHYCVLCSIINDASTDSSPTAQHILYSSRNYTDTSVESQIGLFDYAPRIFYRTGDTADTINKMWGDLDFFTEIDLTYLKKVFDLGYVHMFTVDSIMNAK